MWKDDVKKQKHEELGFMKLSQPQLCSNIPTSLDDNSLDDVN